MYYIEKWLKAKWLRLGLSFHIFVFISKVFDAVFESQYR